MFQLFILAHVLVGRCIGMSGKSLRIIVSGDSAYVTRRLKDIMLKARSSGAVLAVNIVNQILERRNDFGSRDDAQFPLPVSLVLNYAALDFNFTSWMSAENLHVLQYEQSSGNLPGLAEMALQKDHLQHVVRRCNEYTYQLLTIYQESP